LLFKLFKATVHSTIKYNQFRVELGDLLDVKNTKVKINLDASHISNLLVESLSKKKIRVRSHGLGSFTRFIKTYNIESGTSWIKSVILYGIYQKHFKKQKKKPPLYPVEFYKYSDLHFNHTITDDIKYYNISNSVYKKISKDEIEEIKHDKERTFRNEKERRRKIKKQQRVDYEETN